MSKEATARSAMKLALEALDNLRRLPQWTHTAIGIRDVIQAQITALREALAEQPAPVAYIEHHKAGDNLVWDNPGGKHTPLYASQPAQRTWVGLTDDDVRQCSRDVVAGGKENSVDRFAYAIEAKIKEKNNG